MILCQIGWALLVLTAPQAFILPGIFILIACELFVPYYAELASDSSYHRHHIIERYGLLTIIVLGESLLAITIAIGTVAAGDVGPQLIASIIGGLLIMFVSWWLYFGENEYRLFATKRDTFVWGYTHVVIFGSIAATGAGLAVMVDFLTDHAKIGMIAANASVTIPTAIFLVSLWFIHERPKVQPAVQHWLLPATAAVILLTSVLPYAVLITGIVLVICLGLKLWYEVGAQ